MRTVTRFALAALLLATPAVAASDIDDLAARAITAYEQIEGIRKEMRVVTGDLAGRKTAIQQALFALEKAPFGPEELAALDEMIAREESNLARLRKAGVAEADMAYNIRRLTELQLQREGVVIEDDAARAEHRAGLEAERTELTKKITTLEAPFNERIGEVRSTVFPENAALSKALGPFFPEPAGAFEGATVDNMNASMEMAFAGLEWHDAEGNRIAWAHIRIRDDEEITESDRRQMLDGSYPIRTTSDSQLWLWAGNFLITFVPDHESLKNEQALQDAIASFVDLEAMAAVEPSSTTEMAGVDTE